MLFNTRSQRCVRNGILTCILNIIIFTIYIMWKYIMNGRILQNKIYLDLTFAEYKYMHKVLGKSTQICILCI